MLRRTFLKLIGATIVVPALPIPNDNNWDSLLLSEWRPWEPPEHYVGEILTNRITFQKIVCVSVNKGDSYWRDLGEKDYGRK